MSLDYQGAKYVYIGSAVVIVLVLCLIARAMHKSHKNYSEQEKIAVKTSKGLIKMNNVRFFYLRSNGFPVACVAYILEDSNVRYALSVYNPKDKFSKKFAREVAASRLNKGKYFITQLMGNNHTGSICRGLSSEAARNPKVFPARIVKMIERGVV